MELLLTLSSALLGCLFLTLLITSISVIYQFYCKPRESINKLIKVLTIMSLITGMCCVAMDFTHLMIALVLHKHLRDDSLSNIRVLADFFMFSTTITIYCLILGRLYLTFSGSIHKISQKILLFLLTLIIAEIIMMFIYLIILLYSWSLPVTEELNLDQRLSTVLSIVVVIDIVLNISMICLFIYKIQKLMSQKVSEPISIKIHNLKQKDINDIHSDSFDLDEPQQILLKVITRQSVLTFQYIFGVILVFAFRIIVGYLNEFNVWELIYVFRSLIVVASVLCIILGFKFFRGIYDFWCKCCNDGCYMCCMKIAQHNMKTEFIKRKTTTNPSDYRLLND